MDSRCKELIKQGDFLFEQRMPIVPLWQEIYDHFYPERADFLSALPMGKDFASRLSTSYPLIARRTLGDTFGAMMRPSNVEWAQMTCKDARVEKDNEAQRYMQYASTVMRRALYDVKSGFVRASKEGDHDFATAGQCVKQVKLNKDANGLLFRCHHLRDVAWSDDENGFTNTFHVKSKPTARALEQIFGEKNLHEKVKQILKKDPYRPINCRHIIMPSDYYGENKKAGDKPFVSIHIDCDNNHVMFEQFQYNQEYWIPRWQTVSGSQYAYSPAVIAALPDARLIQEMTFVLLEAGQKAARPPMIAVQEALRSDVDIQSGGITWVDAQYDERLGEVLRPLTIDKSGLPIGIDLREDVKAAITEAFYLNKIGLPPRGDGEMTAYEAGQRVQEYIRGALPLFEPMESSDNGTMYELVFDIMSRSGAFGPPDDMPEVLRGKEVQWSFTSPLSDALQKAKISKFQTVQAVMANIAAIAPEEMALLDIRTSLRDVLQSVAPAEWIRTEDAMSEMDEKRAQQQQAQALLANMNQGADTAMKLGKAGQSLAAMGGGV